MAALELSQVLQEAETLAPGAVWDQGSLNRQRLLRRMTDLVLQKAEIQALLVGTRLTLTGRTEFLRPELLRRGSQPAQP